MSEVLGSINRATTTKYTAHKNWNFVSESFLLNNIKYLRGQYSNLPVAISASSAIGEVQNPDGSYIKNTYINLSHLYYTFYDSYGHIKYPQNSFNRELNKECIIYSIPQSKVGLGIKPGSFNLSVDTPVGTISLQDNENYELIDLGVDTSYFIKPSTIYLGFNQEFNSSYKQPYVNNNVTFLPGIKSPSYTFGYGAYFNGTSSIQVEDNGTAWSNTFNNDFAISFWINISSSISSPSPITIISKRWDNTLLQTYPFHISYNKTGGSIVFSYANLYETVTIESDPGVYDAFNHIVCQKTGSTLEIYLNGVINNTYVLADDISISNNSQIYIGAANSSNLNPFTGVLDEIRLYNSALTTNEITALNRLQDTDYSALQTNKVGNVFYEDGIIVYTPLQNELVDLIYNKFDSSFSYKSSLDIQQQKYYINIPMEKYNTSTNPTLYDGTTLRSFATGSDFTPYITSIGLYDSKYNLIGIGKLGSPIAKRNDINLNIEIKFDIS